MDDQMSYTQLVRKPLFRECKISPALTGVAMETRIKSTILLQLSHNWTNMIFGTLYDNRS
jgi:hypothetical protein